MVEYPEDTGNYYFWNLISDEVWKIRRPTKLDEILECLKAYDRADMDFESLDPKGGTKYMKADIPQA